LPTPLSSTQRSELGSPSSSTSDPLLHHSQQQPYNLPSNEADDDLNDGGDNGINDGVGDDN